ncbi:FAD/NAD(P)-binding domain-containing protein [Cucurbitaria berberidis CBS 394.84]|uniref:FAD/NAD(P)-binding domain-containing protein n=1 Tax=Cucurbitaria berberidis CBS 394.84 TaxID=1168544 RepID=A0A9P4GRR8_9PLEO|nr:FAD/NAD(P)-binding domain-containing protein [Cucurbitaria berberidis CBS 394.84]KAF1850137.1 FAD/NAD(P)-binding domain-containing protein [Cucurbitaria berberidis CBS 394.84]
MPPPKHAKILIAGGSVAGLALANSLEKTGIDYLVLEQWHEIAPDVGASIGIFPNGLRILDQLGCYDAITALNEGRDAFDVMKMRNEQGKTVFSMENPSRDFVERLGYEPIFVDRQILIRVLYENLKDKSRVLISKGVTNVVQTSDGVQVETKDGDLFTGEILVGADGIHSAVRREMWRLGNADRPGYFSRQERDEVATEFCCIFGISKSTDKYQHHSAQYVMSQGHSYLLASAPGNRMYWFLFKKLEKTVYGLYEQIPRYTEADENALVEKHANDPLGDALCFGDVYRLRTAATLQALPEVVFSKWHYGRIITIGDAAHKFNPINGQGGNSAIEDAAVLTNELFTLLKGKGKNADVTTENITTAFASMQAKRQNRASRMMKKAHTTQSVQAMDSLSSKLIARYIIPLANKEHGLEALLSASRPAARLEMLAVPSRPHYDSFYDERPARPLKKGYLTTVRLIASGVFLVLIYMATQNMKRSHTLQTSSYGRVETKTYTGVEPLDRIINMNAANSAGMANWSDTGHTLQFLYLASWLAPLLLVWFVEGHRYGARGTLIAWPTSYGVFMHVFSIAITAPVYCLASIWIAAGESYTPGIGRHIPSSTARGLLPSIVLGYVAPMLLMFIPTTISHFQGSAVMWQFAAISISFLVFAFSKSLAPGKQGSSDSYSSDAPHLLKAYKASFLFSLLYHFFTISYVLCSRDPAISFSRLIFAAHNSPGSWNDSREGIFSFMKQELLFSALAMALYGMYNIFDLRRRGLITTDEAVSVSVKFLGGQLVLGPGAALVGLWWWREKKILSISLEGSAEFYNTYYR